MTSKRRVPAQINKISKTRRRALLGHFMVHETRVDIYNPLSEGKGWENVKILGILDEPGMLIERSDGTRWLLPQSFAVEEAIQEEQEPERRCGHCGALHSQPHTLWCATLETRDPNRFADG